MSEDLTQQVTEEVARVSELPLEEQPAAFAAVRDALERALSSDEPQAVQSSSSPNQG
jgi:hypothetical protein